jgi:hypothetical protein
MDRNLLPLAGIVALVALLMTRPAPIPPRPLPPVTTGSGSAILNPCGGPGFGRGC